MATAKLFEITPLGAAIVEKLPDREAVKKIQERYKSDGFVPTSELFPTRKEVDAYYASKKK